MHSRYQRVLADPAIGGRPALLRVRVRRFFCDNTACQRLTFCRAGAGTDDTVCPPHSTVAWPWRRSPWRWAAGLAQG